MSWFLWGPQSVHTLSSTQPIPDTGDAIAEFGLRGFELLEGGGEMLQLLRELVLDLVQLLEGERAEVNCGLRQMSTRDCSEHAIMNG